MNIWQKLSKPPWRTAVVGCCLLLAISLGYFLWNPGLDVRDGRHDRSRNGIWLSHGWLGGDQWFIENGKTNELPSYRDTNRIRNLAEKLHRHHITEVFPHLCPAGPDGGLPPVDSAQVERFLDAFEGLHVMPWIGGPNGSRVRLHKMEWRAAFVGNVQRLFAAHPRLAGVQINVEPLTAGDTNFLTFLDELHGALPKGKLLSVAAYPPPTRWQPSEEVHWNESYLREVAHRSDQLAIMMYDVGQDFPKMYQNLMADWTHEVLLWSDGKPVLFGIPTYNDVGVGYHNPKVENLPNALLGIHRGLSRAELPANYQGVAIYSDWETKETDWQYFHDHFLRQDGLVK